MKRSRTNSSSESVSRQENGHYEWIVGEVIVGKYTVTGFLGDGTFGRVLEVKDLEGSIKAIKIIRAVDRYVEAAKIEARILEKLNKSDPEHKSHIVRLYDHFPLDHNYCLVFERLGKSLYDVIKMNKYKGKGYKGFRMTQVQKFAKQLLQSLDFMHTLGLTHTDLKPENILLVSNQLSWDDEKHAYYPSDCEIRVIDFGGSTFDYEHHSCTINTRQYRAPEVILELGWDTSSDMWSLACILAELYTGELLFPTHKDSEHLAMMKKVLGRMPSWMLKKAARRYKKYFDKDYRLLFPKGASDKTIRNVRNIPVLEDLIRRRYDYFLDLLYKLFEYDPSRRPKAREALRFSFFSKSYDYRLKGVWDYDIVLSFIGKSQNTVFLFNKSYSS